MSAFNHLYNLYEEELFSNCHNLAQFYLSNPDIFNLTPEILIVVYIINGNSLWEMKHYTEAQKQFEEALLLRKALIDPLNFNYTKDVKDQSIILGVIENFNENELKYRIAKCQVENQQPKEAYSILQSITKPRPAKVNFLMCKVIQQCESGSDKNLIALNKEIIKRCPLALECIDSLLNMGVKGNEVNSLVINTTSAEGSSFEWLNLYIKGLSEIHNRKYSEAIITFASIDCLKSNPRILALIGEAFYFSGDYERAYHYLRRSYDIYPYMKLGVQKYALLCNMFKKPKELEQMLKPSSLFPYEYSSTNWFVFATYLYCSLKLDKAQYFINRVLSTYQHKNVDALILNAKILHGNKKPNEALVSLRNALKYEPYRFEVHRWIIEILMATEKGRDAQNQAVKTLKLLGESPRTLTIAASTFLKTPISKEKAKIYLYRALELNEFYVKAVFFLAQVLIDDKETKAAIKLLEKTSSIVSNIKISLMLADLYAKSKNLSSALEQYTKVLNLDPNNRTAMNGIMALGTTASTSLEATADDEFETAENTSRNKNDETNEDELIWSDIEMEIN
ncbi:anaphase-promoting complex subunit 7 [Chironomus tepperi]|uniref:anaphase-promoting complex subunit 7 n=1 Tax=Chironomus tepperi TaxID=113505 RepID=UPI00391FA85B